MALITLQEFMERVNTIREIYINDLSIRTELPGENEMLRIFDEWGLKFVFSNQFEIQKEDLERLQDLEQKIILNSRYFKDPL